MPTEALVYLNKATVTSSGSNLTFTSISGSYKTLLCVFNGANNASANSVLYARFNNNSGSVYTYIGAYGTNSPSATAEYNGSFNANSPVAYAWLGRVIGNSNSNSRSMCTLYVNQYANGSYGKTWQSLSYGPNAVGKWAGAFNSTTAITRLDFISDNGFVAGTTATLYGMSA